MNEQGGGVGDFATDEVGQAAVSEGDLGAALKNDDVRGLIQTPSAGSCAHAAGDTANDDDRG